MKTYMFNIGAASDLWPPGGCFGKVLAPNLRKARALLRMIFKVRALPAKSRVW